MQTDTSDVSGKIINVDSDTIKPFYKAQLNEKLNSVLDEFSGIITQVPTKFSAIKINGIRAYELARAGKEFEMPAREVQVYYLKVVDNLDVVLPESLREYSSNYVLNFEVASSSGLYVRTLAEDIAKKLGTVGVVTYLQRIESDGFNLDMIADQVFPCKITSAVPYKIIDLNCLASIWPQIVLQEQEIARLRLGQRVRITKLPEDSADYYSCIDSKGNFHGMVGCYKLEAEEQMVQKTDQSAGGVIFPSCMVKT